MSSILPTHESKLWESPYLLRGSREGTKKQVAPTETPKESLHTVRSKYTGYF